MAYKTNTNVGKLNKRITFLTAPEGTDEDGFPVVDWQAYKTVWGEVYTLKGRNFYQAAKDNVQDLMQVTVRYRDDIDDTMRLRIKGVTYRITSIMNDNLENQWLTIHVKELKEDES